jgi:hypothetical protein
MLRGGMKKGDLQQTKALMKMQVNGNDPCLEPGGGPTELQASPFFTASPTFVWR